MYVFIFMCLDVCFYVFRTRARVPGGLGGRSPGLLGRLPGGGSPPKLLGPAMVMRLAFSIQKHVSILMSILDRLGVDLGSVLGQ